MKRLAIVLGSLAVTGGLLSLVLMLGSWAYDHRRFLSHETRLARLVQQKPSLDQVTEALRAEGSRLLAAPRGEAQLRRLAARWPGVRGDEIVVKGTRHRETRVFLAGDMVYVLYFDEEGVLRDFTCVSD